MTPPDTKIATQTRRHRGPLIGMAIGLLFGVMMILYWSSAEDTQTELPVEAHPATVPSPSPDAAAGSPVPAAATSGPSSNL